MEDIPLVFTNNNAQSQNTTLTNTNISPENNFNNKINSTVTEYTHSDILKQEKQSIVNTKKSAHHSRRGEMPATASSDMDENDCGGGGGGSDENSTKRVNKYSTNKNPMNNRLYMSSNKSSKLMHRCFNFKYVKNTNKDYNLLNSTGDEDSLCGNEEETDQLTTQTISFETTELTNFNSSNSKRACCCCCCCFYCCCNLFNRILTVCFK